MKQSFIILSVALLTLFASSAFAFDLSVSEQTISIHTGETKTIELVASSSIDDVIVFSVPIEQPWMSIPTHTAISAGETRTIKIVLSPFDRTQPSIYKLDLLAEAIRAKERIAKNITVSVRAAQVAIEKVSITGDLEPSGWGQLEMYVKNYENTSASAVLSVMAGPFLNWSSNLTLAAGEFVVIKKGFTIPECQSSGEYSVRADIDFRGAKVFSTEEKFVIPENFMPIVIKNETSSGVRTTTTVNLKNVGNIDGTTEYSDQIPGALFFSGDKPTRTTDAFTWVLNVGACQARTITYSIDYTPIPVGLFVIFAIWYVFFRLRTVRVAKRILQKSTIEKGIEFTVGIDVKSWVGAKDVEIHDFVPSLFEVRDTPGIKPIKNRTDAGTELIWRFKQFDRYEERILDYKIVPLFSINGQVTLPRATVSFNFFGRKITKSSDTASLGLTFTAPVEHAGKAADAVGGLMKFFGKKKSE